MGAAKIRDPEGEIGADAEQGLNKNEFALGWRLKDVVSLGGIFFTHQDFEPEAAPCEMVAHAASSIGLIYLLIGRDR